VHSPRHGGFVIICHFLTLIFYQIIAIFAVSRLRLMVCIILHVAKMGPDVKRRRKEDFAVNILLLFYFYLDVSLV
jgi:hypothetical protein